MINPNRFPSGWESGCGAADPAMSAIATDRYKASGYQPMASGEVGTINAGANTPVTPQPPPAQLRAYVQGGVLYFLDNITGIAYAAGPAVSVPEPPVYSPTK